MNTQASPSRCFVAHMKDGKCVVVSPSQQTPPPDLAFIGGHPDPGMSAYYDERTAMLREVHEESGVSLSSSEE